MSQEFKEMILTDFNDEVWKKFDYESIERCVYSIINHSNEFSLYGELGLNESMNINISNISHIISNIIFEDNVVYGDIKIISTFSGKMALSLNGNFKPKIRCYGSKYSLEKIVTWDLAPMNLIDKRNKIIDNILK